MQEDFCLAFVCEQQFSMKIFSADWLSVFTDWDAPTGRAAAIRKRSHGTTWTRAWLTLCPKLVLGHLHIQIVVLSEHALFTSSERRADVSLHCLSIWIFRANVLSEALKLHFGLLLLSRFISYSKNSFYIQRITSWENFMLWSLSLHSHVLTFVASYIYFTLYFWSKTSINLTVPHLQQWALANLSKISMKPLVGPHRKSAFPIPACSCHWD